MRFIHIDPDAQTVETVEAEDWRDVAPHIGEVDHGVVMPGVGIFVGEHGLMEGDGPYFALRGVLYAGEAVLYAFDERGESVNIAHSPPGLFPPVWFVDKQDVELGIAAGMVARPVAAINGAVVWEWS